MSQADPLSGMEAPSADPMAAFSGMPAPTPSGPPTAQGGGFSIPEPSALREWEAKHEQELEEMAREEAKQKEAQRQEGSGKMTKWHAERKENITKKKAANRTEE